jgi:hypothetical protein
MMADLIDGLTSTPPPGVTTVVVNGTTFTMPELLAQLGIYHAAFTKAEQAEDARALAVKEREDIAVAAAKLLAGARTLLKGMLGKQNPALTAFGIAPDKTPTPLTVEQEVAKVAKGKATRVARHTMGKKQKAKLHG